VFCPLCKMVVVKVGECRSLVKRTKRMGRFMRVHWARSCVMFWACEAGVWLEAAVGCGFEFSS
jgi:hypothetical protein